MPRMNGLNTSPRASLQLVLALTFSFVFPDTVLGQLGSNVPDDATLIARRQAEVTSGFVVEPPNQTLRPAERVRRDTFGDVGLAPLSTGDQLERLLFPSVPPSAHERVLGGASFFTTPLPRRKAQGRWRTKPDARAVTSITWSRFRVRGCSRVSPTSVALDA